MDLFFQNFCMKPKVEKPRTEILWQTMKVTSDDWHPCFDGSMVRVTIHKYPLENLHKFVVAGADDTVMSLYTQNSDKVTSTYKWLNQISVVTMRDLLDYGFEYE